MSQSLETASVDLAREYRAGHEAAALVTLARGTLEVSGPKRQDFLHAMLSNEVKALGPGAGCRAASMTAKGALQALLRVLVDRSVVVLETERDRLEPVLRTLEFHKVGAPVRFALGKTAVLAVFGPRAGEVLSRRRRRERCPRRARRTVEVELGGTTLRLVRASDLPGAGFVLHAPHEAAEAVAGALRAAGAEPDRRARRSTRCASRRSARGTGSTSTEDNLLHETGLVGVLHSSTKGCYVGQEVIARLEGRGGHVNKALRGLRLSAPAAAGATVTAAGKDVGCVTTAARVAAARTDRARLRAPQPLRARQPASRSRVPRPRSSRASRSGLEDLHQDRRRRDDRASSAERACPRTPRASPPTATSTRRTPRSVRRPRSPRACSPSCCSGIQRDLFAIGARLADPTHEVASRRAKAAVTPAHVRKLEKAIDARERELPPLRAFVLPGGTPLGAQLHQARTVVRRAERSVVALSHQADVEAGILVYLNRLSDLLFVLARHANHRAGVAEDTW